MNGVRGQHKVIDASAQRGWVAREWTTNRLTRRNRPLYCTAFVCTRWVALNRGRLQELCSTGRTVRDYFSVIIPLKWPQTGHEAFWLPYPKYRTEQPDDFRNPCNVATVCTGTALLAFTGKEQNKPVVQCAESVLRVDHECFRRNGIQTDSRMLKIASSRLRAGARPISTGFNVACDCSLGYLLHGVLYLTNMCRRAIIQRRTIKDCITLRYFSCFGRSFLPNCAYK